MSDASLIRGSFAAVLTTVLAAGSWAQAQTPGAEGLSGDWFGGRTLLAESGVDFQAAVTQFYFGNTAGGVDREFRYAGRGDYVLNLDAGKMGVQEGFFVKLRAEHRFGEPIGGASGAFLPETIAAALPVPDSEQVYLTNVLFTQALSENFILYAGKLDTLDGDLNAFAHGRGLTQFSNTSFVVNPIAFRTVPYSTLGAGFAILDEGLPLFMFSVLNPVESAATSGFERLGDEGVALSAQLRLPTAIAGLPGHQLLAGTWSSRNYVSLGQDARVVLPNVPIDRTSGSWSLFWNCDQYLFVDAANPARGWGLFGRAAIGDDQANPIAWFLSAGVGGSSPLPGRAADGFGVGWYYVGGSDQVGRFAEFLLGPIGDGQGVELFYDVAVTPSIHVTPDVQMIVPSREQIDPALLIGVRARMVF